MILLLLLLVCRAVSRTACDFYSRYSYKKNESCFWCIQSGLNASFPCVFTTANNWCKSVEEALPLMCVGDTSLYKTHIYECSLL